MAGEDGDRQRESRRILERMARESDPTGSLAARAVRRVRDHVGAADADGGDPVELWGTRIGRILGLVLLAVLTFWLLSYIAGG